MNCTGPLTLGFFNTVNTIVLHHPWLVVATDMEPRTGRGPVYGGAAYTGALTLSYVWTLTGQRVGDPVPMLFKGQPYLLQFVMYAVINYVGLIIIG